jgi:twitching motility protein PilJ
LIVSGISSLNLVTLVHFVHFVHLLSAIRFFYEAFAAMTTQFRPARPDDGRSQSGGTTSSASDLMAASEPTGVHNYTGGDRSRPGNVLDPANRPSEPRQPKASGMQWFLDLPVRRKQLLGLLTAELISVVGIVGVGSLLIVSAGRSQLIQQAKSELAVTRLQYNVKLNQMALGFRGQAENPVIVEMAKSAASGQSASPDLRAQVKGLLSQEVKTRQIEYATLVGVNARIIASANADRTGDQFDPQGLVGTVLANPRQITASAIVSGAELKNEAPPLPDGFNQQDALIRYTITPVRDPKTQAVIGALISGDLVDGKPAIAESTLEAFKNGYSAVYLRQPDGQFFLSTSMDLGSATDIKQAQINAPLADPSLLNAAAQTNGGEVTQRVKVGEQTYTMAAEAVQNFNGESVAVLVRGTSESALNDLIRNSLLLQLAVGAGIVAIDVALAALLGRTIVSPLDRLRRVALGVAQGDRHVRAEVFANDEVGQLTQTFNELVDNIAHSEVLLREQYQQQEVETEKAQLLADLTSQIRQSLDAEEIFRTAVEGVRNLLQADRVVFYQFHLDFKSGTIAAESVGRGWLRALGQTINDPLVPGAIDRYRGGKISLIEDLSKANLTECHCEILRRLEVKANMVVPLLADKELIGLLCVHQCSEPRAWQQGEVYLMQQLSTQIGYALSQAALVKQKQQAADYERQITEIVLHLRESLDREKIFRTVTKDTLKVLGANRVIIYLFDESWQGTVTAEAVEHGWNAALGTRIADPCFADKYVEKYRQGRVQATTNIYEAGYTECHLKQLEPFQVIANLVAPILVGDRLIGLLVAHQCSGPRNWQDSEINFLRQIAAQLGFTLEQVDLFAQRDQARLDAEALFDEQRQQKESLQLQLLNLLSDVEGATRGDLTVRADVTAGEIGTVADFFNSIVESLRQIVTKVKQSALQVNTSLGKNEGAISQLAEEALLQAEEITRTLNSVEQMTLSIQSVAASAQQAAEVARTASVTAEAGGAAMDLTVQNILGLRETVGETAKKVKRLGESSQQISKVVSLINQIAMQTNLLAINAGIEAARAGEEGQGFAVVAEEVGELAARSAAATHEIESIVNNIQRETNQVVEAMEQSTAQVVEGTHLVEDAKQSLTQILGVSRQIDQLVGSISEATVSQVETSEVVTRLMKEIAQVSERTSDSSRQVSGALRETVEIAQALQDSVGAFEVGEGE